MLQLTAPARAVGGYSALPALIKKGEVRIDWLDEATQSWRVVANNPGVRAKEVLAAAGVETLHHYRSKTRRYINAKRQAGEQV